MVDLSPQEVARWRDLRVVDVRELDERRGVPGFIPGSRMMPSSILMDHPETLLRWYQPHMPLVLVCMSGRRSERLLRRVRGIGFIQVHNMAGGVLAWGAAGLPLAGSALPLPNTERTVNIDSLVRDISSCFVAEVVEHDLAADTFEMDFNPRQMVRDLFEAEFRAAGARNVWAARSALDALGEQARLRGHELEHIAENLDATLQALDAVTDE